MQEINDGSRGAQLHIKFCSREFSYVTSLSVESSATLLVSL